MWSNRQKLHDAEAESARQHLPESTMPWQAPGARVVAVGGSHGDGVGGAVSVGSLYHQKLRDLHGQRFPRSPRLQTDGEPRRVGGGSRRRQPQQRSDSAGAAQGCPKRQHMGGLRPARGEPPPVLPRAARRSQCTAARVRAGRRRLLDESYWHKCHSLRLGCLWTSDR